MNDHTLTQQQETPARIVTPVGNSILRRKCSCGQHTVTGSECGECRKKWLNLQRKATVHTEPKTAPPIVHEVLHSPGQPLDSATRAFMESRFSHNFSQVQVRTTTPQLSRTSLTVGPVNDHFEQEADRAAVTVMHMSRTNVSGESRSTVGFDFSQVRMHTDAKAAESAKAVNALAYTVGQHIIFGAGQYAPHSRRGRSLLAHELMHTLQQGAESRLSRACESDLAAIPIPAGDSTFTGHAFVNLATVSITPDVSISPLAGNFHVKIHVPRDLQRLISPSILSGMSITLDISATLASEGAAELASQYAGNELCVFVTFRREGPMENWYADLRLLPGGNFVAPLQIGAVTPTLLRPPQPSPLGTGIARIRLRLAQELTASVGPFRINSMEDFRATWSRILDQVRDTLAVRIANIRVPLDLRTGVGLTVPVPVSGGPPEEASVIPVRVLGDIRLTTSLSTEEEGFHLRLSGAASGTAVAGLVSLELSGRGRLRGPLPSSVRLGDLSGEFLRELLALSEGEGEITGRLRAFGLPGQVNADFRLLESQLVGDATFISPLILGGGTFNYHLSEGLSADLGMVGLTHLTLAPAEDRLVRERRSIGPAPLELGTSVTGFGVTGLRLTPSTIQVLSAGVGPQFIKTPAGEGMVGVYGGLQYRIDF